MSRLDLKCITELLPTILDKSSKEDIKNLEKLIHKYKFKNYEEPWLFYFADAPSDDYFRTIIDIKYRGDYYSLNEFIRFNEVDINKFKEENRIKDPRIFKEGDNFYLINRYRSISNRQILNINLCKYNLPKGSIILNTYKYRFNYAKHNEKKRLLIIDAKANGYFKVNCDDDGWAYQKINFLDDKFYLYKF